ncbi:hypothetical protein ACFVYF_26215 [Streptomyces sp. NPDC058274]|uniref:hypothetical protein n=1 Tax=Streptomyces sp. NPDC058274 TaxID=3346416 RepID=UPI0036F0CE7D
MGISLLAEEEAAQISGGAMSKTQCRVLYNEITSGAIDMYGSADTSGYISLYRSQCKGKGPKL